MRKSLLIGGLVALLGTTTVQAKEYETVQAMIAETPISEFQPGFVANWQNRFKDLFTMRGSCEDAEGKHILIDLNGNEVGIVHTELDGEDNQTLINEARKELGEDIENPIDIVLAPEELTGYPFAKRCDPDIRVEEAVTNFMERILSDRFWHRFPVESNISMRDFLEKTNEEMRNSGEIPFDIFDYMTGIFMIEGGGHTRHVLSHVNAYGPFQYKERSFELCDLPRNPRTRNEYKIRHRFATAECTIRDAVDRFNYLHPIMHDFFGDMPKRKADELQAILAFEGHNINQGVYGIFENEETIDRVREIAINHEQYSPLEISTLVLFTNFGHKLLPNMTGKHKDNQRRIALNAIMYMVKADLAQQMYSESL